MASPRIRKIADRIQVIVAEMLERRIKDPRLGFVTITDVRVTGDTQQATVFYTVLGDADAVDDSAAALRSATGLIRSEVGRQLGMRHTPTLDFVLDGVPENARHIEELLARARAADAEVARAAANAQYAGDPDPYRHDGDGDGDGAEVAADAADAADAAVGVDSADAAAPAGTAGTEEPAGGTGRP